MKVCVKYLSSKLSYLVFSWVFSWISWILSTKYPLEMNNDNEIKEPLCEKEEERLGEEEIRDEGSSSVKLDYKLNIKKALDKISGAAERERDLYSYEEKAGGNHVFQFSATTLKLVRDLIRNLENEGK